MIYYIIFCAFCQYQFNHFCQNDQIDSINVDIGSRQIGRKVKVIDINHPVCLHMSRIRSMFFKGTEYYIAIFQRRSKTLYCKGENALMRDHDAMITEKPCGTFVHTAKWVYCSSFFAHNCQHNSRVELEGILKDSCFAKAHILTPTIVEFFEDLFLLFGKAFFEILVVTRHINDLCGHSGKGSQPKSPRRLPRAFC